MYRLRVRLFQSLLAQEVGFYDRVRTGGGLGVGGWGALASICARGGVGSRKLQHSFMPGLRFVRHIGSLCDRLQLALGGGGAALLLELFPT